MGLLAAGLASGLGEGMVALAADERKRWAAKDDADLAEQKAKNLAEFQLLLADKQRQQKADRINAATAQVVDQKVGANMASALEAYTNPNATVDGRPLTAEEIDAAKAAVAGSRDTQTKEGLLDLRNVRQGALNVGDYETATAVSNMAKTDDLDEYRSRTATLLDAKNTALAQARDENLVLKTALTKSNIAKNDSIIGKNNRAGQPKPLTDADKLKYNKLVDDYVGRNFNEDKKFVPLGAKENEKGDDAKRGVLSLALQTTLERAHAQGINTDNTSELFGKVRGVVDAYDKQVWSEAEEVAKRFFDGDKPKKDAGKELAALGFNQMTAATKQGFLQAYRDQQLKDPKNFEAFIAEARRASSAPAKADASAAPAAAPKPDDQPAATPVAPAAKPEGLMAAKADDDANEKARLANYPAKAEWKFGDRSGPDPLADSKAKAQAKMDVDKAAKDQARLAQLDDMKAKLAQAQRVASDLKADKGERRAAMQLVPYLQAQINQLDKG